MDKIFYGWGRDKKYLPCSTGVDVNVRIYTVDDPQNPCPEPLGLRPFVVRPDLDRQNTYDIWVRQENHETVKAALAHLNGVTPDAVEIIFLR